MIDPTDTSDMPPPPNGLPVAIAEELRTAASSILLERARFARDVGITFEGKRDLYKVLGYPRSISVREYRETYMRGGIAGSIVDVMPDATWRGEMWLEEDEDPKVSTPFEEAWAALDQKHQIQSKLLRVDKLSRLSTYAVLLIGARGNLETELPRGNDKTLLYLQPYLGGGGPNLSSSQSRTIVEDADCTVEEYETDPSSERFGLPRSYRLKRTDVASPAFARPVHWTRIIHVAEGLLDDDVYGMPALERVWNLLIDLEKVTGGGAEAFWLRANQGLQLDVDKDMSLPDAKLAIAELKEQAEDYKNQLTRWLRTRGVEVKTLGSDVANFNTSADAIITQIAGSKRIPKRILTGSEMGELASSQDRENFKDQVDGRQKQHAGPYIVRQLADRLIKYGYLPTPAKGPMAYEVKWPHVQTLTEDERTAGAKAWSETKTDEGQVYTNAEIRDKWYDMEPLTKEQLDEIAARQQEKLEQAQAVMAAKKPPADDDDEGDGKFPRAAEAREDAELLEILEAAIATHNVEVLEDILGFTVLGHPVAEEETT